MGGLGSRVLYYRDKRETKHQECECGGDPHAHPPGLYLQLEPSSVSQTGSRSQKGVSESQRPGTFLRQPWAEPGTGDTSPASLTRSHGSALFSTNIGLSGSADNENEYTLHLGYLESALMNRWKIKSKE